VIIFSYFVVAVPQVSRGDLNDSGLGTSILVDGGGQGGGQTLAR
jgi:hypothetical protein